MNITKELIYYSPISFGRMTRSFWGLIDMLATYHSMLILCTLLILLFNWQFNLILVIHVICQVYHMICIGSEIKGYNKKNKRQDIGLVYTDDDLEQEMKNYSEDFKKKTINIRKGCWFFHAMLLVLTVILMYPS